MTSFHSGRNGRSEALWYHPSTRDVPPPTSPLLLRKVGRFLLIALLVVYVVGAFLFLPWWMGGQFTSGRFRYNDKENAGLTPATFEIAYEDVTFTSRDGVRLSGWWVPATAAKGTVVLVHGLNRSRIEMVKKLPFVHRSGWNALLFDLRHHGESGGGISTFGAREKDDVLAAVAFARAKGPGPVVVWGVSLGAAASVLAVDEDPTIDALICDSTYRSLRDTVRHHLGLFRRFAWFLRIVPTWPVADETVFWLGRRGGFDPDAVDIRAAVARGLRGRPALFVANSHDRRMPKDIAEELARAAGPHAALLVVEGESHGGAYRDGTAAYEAAVTKVLGAVAGQPAPVATPTR